MELSQEEQIILEVFTADTGAFSTVQKIALDYIEQQKDVFIRNLTVKKDIPNDEIGAKIRAFDEAVYLVRGIFNEISVYRKKTPESELKNPGR